MGDGDVCAVRSCRPGPTSPAAPCRILSRPMRGASSSHWANTRGVASTNGRTYVAERRSWRWRAAVTD